MACLRQRDLPVAALAEQRLADHLEQRLTNEEQATALDELAADLDAAGLPDVFAVAGTGAVVAT